MIPIPPAAAAFIARAGVQSAWRIAKIAVPVLAVLGLVIAVYVLREQRDGARDQRDALQHWQNSVVVAVTDATVPPDAHGRRAPVSPDTVVTRIGMLAGNVRELEGAIARQNAAIAAAQAQGEARLEDARRASAAAVQRNAARETTRRALEAPGRSTGLTAPEWSQL